MTRAEEFEELRPLLFSIAYRMLGGVREAEDAALRRFEEHAFPLESIRSEAAYGRPSAVDQLLVLNAKPRTCRGFVLLLREAIGF